MKAFKDYPEDLQEIVNHTIESGWWEGSKIVEKSKRGDHIYWYGENTVTESGYTRTDYEKCRAAYLHETAGDAKGSEVDWRSLVNGMLMALEEAHNQLTDSHDEVDAFGILGQIEKARTALERTK